MPSPFDHIVVLDFEATCNNGPPPAPQEIIEFPSVLLSLADHAVVDEFSSFVRPVHHPQLTDFCRELTGIEQADVDAAPAFLDVLAAHQSWLASHHLETFLFVSAGDWDFVTMLPNQCATAGVPVPHAYRRWCNIKAPFTATIHRAKSSGMTSMLRALGLELEGRHHRGIDDSRNIARIVLALHDRGATLDVTSRLSPSQFPELPLTLRWQDKSVDVVLKKRSVLSLLGLASGLLRTKIVAVQDHDGAPLTDNTLQELAPGASLRALGPRD
jgi:ERI1 exoribonuclease 2